jgi:DNA-binding HxlR family transcriptional regulator/putative sterol carrier protein
MSTMRSYRDPCGIARALDRIGERWALLVVRELLFGPKRFTDLRAGLPGASPNVLAERLRELERAGVVQRRKLEPPAAVHVYELTRWGMELEGVLLALGRWGSRAPLVDGELSPDALLVALQTTFDAGAAAGVRATCELRLGDARFHLRVAGGKLEIARGGAGDPDVRLATDPSTLRRLVFGGERLADAVRAGRVEVDGDRRAAERLLRLFPRPQPAG